MTNPKHILLAAVFALLLLPCALLAQPDKPQGRYMTQSFVDTTIMRAILVLNEAAAYQGMNNMQERAVNRANAILDDLRQKAKGDPNERYVHTKIQEVEMLIALEMEEIRKIREDKKIIAANQLVIQYNSEAGLPRPDFAKLRGIFRRMGEVDTRQANTLATYYNRRYRQVSKEVTYTLEKALNEKNFALAKSELEYADANKHYLMISSSYLEAQRTRMEGMQGAHTDWPRIITQLDEGEKAYNEFRLAESRTNLTMAVNRIGQIGPHLPPREVSAASARATRLMRALDTREDSLVRTAFIILSEQGSDAAITYVQDVLQKQMSLSPEYESIIDQAIFSTLPSKSQDPSASGIQIDYIPGEASGVNPMDAVQRIARVRGQERADSIKMEREKAEKIAANIYALLDRKKSKDAARQFEKEKTFLASALDKNNCEMLELSVNHGAKVASDLEEFKKHRDKAHDYTARIYTLIERNDIKEARHRFDKYKKPLQKYLDKNTYQMLEMAVTQSVKHASKGKNKKK